MTEIERCEQEIVEIERLIRAGYPDIEGLCLALSDWRVELRLIQGMSGGAPLTRTPFV